MLITISATQKKTWFLHLQILWSTSCGQLRLVNAATQCRPRIPSKHMSNIQNPYGHPITHRLHVCTYIYHTNPPNVGKYTSPMDCLGYTTDWFLGILIMAYQKSPCILLLISGFGHCSHRPKNLPGYKALTDLKKRGIRYPGSYIWLICMVNVGKYTIHGSWVR